MNIVDIIVLAAVIIWLAAAVIHSVRKKLRGGCIGCSECCSCRDSRNCGKHAVRTCLYMSHRK